MRGAAADTPRRKVTRYSHAPGRHCGLVAAAEPGHGLPLQPAGNQERQLRDTTLARVALHLWEASRSPTRG